jgi:hypothetical protein
MTNTFTVRGTYGTNNPCQVICYLLPYSYTTAYVVEGSKNICFTNEEVNEGVNVETITDYDYITANFPVEDEWSLIEEVDEVMS